MVKNLLKYHVSTKSYLSLKFRNVVKFYVHIRPIFSCRVTIFIVNKLAINLLLKLVSTVLAWSHVLALILCQMFMPIT